MTEKPKLNDRIEISPTLLSRNLLELINKFNVAKEFNPREHEDKTRSSVAICFTLGYFFLLLIALVGTPVYDAILMVKYGLTDPSQLLQVKDVLLTVAGIIGGPIGFVVGYYFKGSERKR
jgi:hypothetical protein